MAHPIGKPPPQPPNPNQSRWLLIEYAHSWVADTLFIACTTDVPVHLYLRWTDKPLKKHLEAFKFAGLQMEWDPRFCLVEWNQVQQNEPGDTLHHTFHFSTWADCQTRWWLFIGTVAGINSPSITCVFTAHYLDYKEAVSLRHIDLTDKQVAGVIDHADLSVTPAKLSSPFTFSQFPFTPAQPPAQNYHVANKKYVDDSLVPAPADYPKQIDPTHWDTPYLWSVPGWYVAASTAWGMYDNQLYCIPIFPAEQTHFDRIAIWVTATGTGVARLGVYAWAQGLPGALILDAGTVTALTTGEKSLPINWTPARGYYFLVFVSHPPMQVRSFHPNYAVTSPVAGVMGTAEHCPYYPVHVIENMGAAVAGGLPNPAPRPTRGQDHTFAGMVRLRRTAT